VLIWQIVTWDLEGGRLTTLFDGRAEKLSVDILTWSRRFQDSLSIVEALYREVTW
jgi:hypothetical protein